MLRLNIAPVIAVIPALIVRTDRRIVADLRRADATAPDRAIELPGPALRRARTRRLTNAGALRKLSSGRYYLVEDGWRAWRANRRRRMMIAAPLALLLGWILFSRGGN